MKRLKLLPLLLFMLVVVACSDGENDLVGEWIGTESSGNGGTVTFNDNETLLVEMGAFNNSFDWTVEDSKLNLYTTNNGTKDLAYQYEIEQQSKDDITLYELDEEGNRVEGSVIKLTR